MIRTEIKIPVFKNVIVDKGSIRNNKIPIQYELANNKESSFLAEQLYATCISGTIPPQGTRGVVVYPDSSDKNTCYWLGSLDASAKTLTPLSSYTSDDKTTMLILNSNKTALGHQNGTGIFITNNDVQISTQNNNSVKLHSEGLNIDIGKNGNIIFGRKTIISLPNINANITNSAIFRISDGAFQITGKIDQSESSGGDLNDPVKYLPCEGFFVNAKKTIIRCTGMTQINSAGLKINLASSLLTNGGLGGDNTLDVNITRGNAKLNIGQGDIELRTNNIALLDKITIMCGSKISPMNAGVTFSALETSLMNRVVWGIDSSLSLSKASATLDAFRDITMTSKIGSATLTSLLQTTIEGIVSAKLTSAMLEIEGKVQTVMKGAMLDLQQTKMINTGPKTVTPTGTGPLCAIPVCPYTGAPHVGFCAVG